MRALHAKCDLQQDIELFQEMIFAKWKERSLVYACGTTQNKNRFANILRIARQQQLTPQNVILTLMSKHWDALVQHSISKKPGQPNPMFQSHLQEWVTDLSVYLCILYLITTKPEYGTLHEESD